MSRTLPEDEGSVERYSRLRPVGERGGGGEVWLCHDTLLDRTCVLKRLHLGHAASASLRERFVREARNTARLAHPNIVVVYDAGFDGQPWIVMEYAEGGSVESAFPGRVAPGLALGIVAQACVGVAHAHRQGVIHRDLKPANLLLDEHGTVKVADFGIALDPGGRLTRAGVGFGTPGYLPPEQEADAASVDVRADVYALGATLYRLLSGEDPVALRSAAARPHALGALPPPLADLVGRATAPDREVRTSNVDALRREIEGAGIPLLRVQPAGATSASPLAAAPSGPAGRTPGTPTWQLTAEPSTGPRWAVLGGLVALLGLVGWGLVGRDERPSSPAEGATSPLVGGADNGEPDPSNADVGADVPPPDDGDAGVGPQGEDAPEGVSNPPKAVVARATGVGDPPRGPAEVAAVPPDLEVVPTATLPTSWSAAPAGGLTLTCLPGGCEAMTVDGSSALPGINRVAAGAHVVELRASGVASGPVHVEVLPDRDCRVVWDAVQRSSSFRCR